MAQLERGQGNRNDLQLHATMEKSVGGYSFHHGNSTFASPYRDLLAQMEKSVGGDSRSFRRGNSVSPYRDILTEQAIPDTTNHQKHEKPSQNALF